MESGRGAPVVLDRPGTHWRAHAVCANTVTDPDLFFPVGVGPAARAQEAEAKRLCFICPVMLACREWAQDIHGLEGVWGGRSRRDRDHLRRKLRQNPSGRNAPPADTEHGREHWDDGRVAYAVQGAR
jgi:WhiB family transcriptional regulator, redox-sensing transcriptional regulator